MDRLWSGDWWWNTAFDGIGSSLLAAALAVLILRSTLGNDRKLAREAAEQDRDLAREAAAHDRALAREAADLDRTLAREAAENAQAITEEMAYRAECSNLSNRIMDFDAHHRRDPEALQQGILLYCDVKNHVGVRRPIENNLYRLIDAAADLFLNNLAGQSAPDPDHLDAAISTIRDTLKNRVLQPEQLKQRPREMVDTWVQRVMEGKAVSG